MSVGEYLVVTCVYIIFRVEYSTVVIHLYCHTGVFMNGHVYLEIQADDLDRAANFYTKIFGEFLKITLMLLLSIVGLRLMGLAGGC